MTEGEVFDGSPGARRRSIDSHPQGAKHLCPVCRAELVVAPTWKEGAARNVRPGVYCPTDLRHVCGNFILG